MLPDENHWVRYTEAATQWTAAWPLKGGCIKRLGKILMTFLSRNKKAGGKTGWYTQTPFLPLCVFVCIHRGKERERGKRGGEIEGEIFLPPCWTGMSEPLLWQHLKPEFQGRLETDLRVTHTCHPGLRHLPRMVGIDLLASPHLDSNKTYILNRWSQLVPKTSRVTLSCPT